MYKRFKKMPNFKHISTLEYYNYGETNNFNGLRFGSYRVKISDKEKNIITIDKDGALYGSVGLEMDGTTLRLLDASNNNNLAEIELPNAGEISNIKFDSDKNAILFDILTLDGNIQAVELDIESIITVYEAGNGISFDDTENENTKKISIKLAEGEEVLHVNEEGLYLDGKVIVEEELEEALDDYAKKEELQEESEAREELEKKLEEKIDDLKTEDEQLAGELEEIKEQLNTKADKSDLEDIQGKVDEIESNFEEFYGKADSDKEEINETIEGIYNDAIFSCSYMGGSTPAIKFFNKKGETTSEVSLSEIFADELGPIADTKYDAEKDELILVTNSGQEIRIDLHEFLDIDEAGDGLKIVDSHKIYIDIDGDSEEYLTVGEKGLKVSGIDEKFDNIEKNSSNLGELINSEINRAKEVEAQIWTNLEGETNARITVEKDLWSAITGETENRNSVEKEIWGNIGNIYSELNKVDGKIESAAAAEEKERSDADDELRKALDKETAERKASDESNSEAIKGAVKQAEENDAKLKSDIDGVSDTCEQHYNELKALIDEKDDSDILKDELAEAKANLEARDSELEGLIESTKESINNEIDAIKSELIEFNDKFATIEYVDGALESLSTDVDKRIEALGTNLTEWANKMFNDLKDAYDAKFLEYASQLDNLQTQISLISTLPGYDINGNVTNGEYECSEGQGILDKLHCEFHNMNNNYI